GSGSRAVEPASGTSSSREDRLLRRLIRAAVVGAAACGLALAGIVGVSEFRLRDYDLPSPFTATIPRDSGSVARGKHLARTRGCFGCHGQRLEGRVFAEWTWVRR